MNIYANGARQERKTTNTPLKNETSALGISGLDDKNRVVSIHVFYLVVLYPPPVWVTKMVSGVSDVFFVDPCVRVQNIGFGSR